MRKKHAGKKKKENQGEEIQAGNFPKCTKDTNPQIPEVLQSPSRRNKKILTLRHVIAELEKPKRKIVQAARGRHYNGRQRRTPWAVN